MSIQLLRLGDANTLTQAGGEPFIPEDLGPVRYAGA